MEVSNINFNTNKTLSKSQTKTKKTLNTKESIAALYAGSVASIATMPVSSVIISKMAAQSKNLTPEQIKIVNEAAEGMLKTTGLTEKGVKIVDAAQFAKSAKDLESKFETKISEILNPIYTTAKGKNAFFANKTIPNICNANSVILNKEKLSLAAFHELGHAMNYNTSKFWKTMQTMRVPSMLIAGMIAFLPAYTKESKAEEGKELTKGQKFKNNLRKASPALAFVAMIPMLLEEGKASLRGCKWANANMVEDLAKKVSKTNKIAYLSYLASALGMALTAFTTLKIKDKLVEKKEAKIAMQKETITKDKLKTHQG